MFQYKIAGEFRKRAQAAAPFPRGLVEFGASSVAAAHGLGRGPFAAFAAIVLGGVLMAANLTVARKETPVVEAPAVATQAPVVAQAAAPPVQAAPAAPAEAAPPPTKSTARVDMTPTGALPSDATPKLHHKPHVAKKKNVDAKR